MADTTGNKPPLFHILICLIEIWEEGTYNSKEHPQKSIMLTEVESVKIEDSYKNLFKTATVKFPKGTVIKKTLTKLNVEKETLSVSVEDNGVVVATRTNSSKAQVSDFKVGQRIRIYLGYTDNPKIAAMTKPNANKQSIFNNSTLLGQYRGAMSNMFDGYIVKCSVDEPIEIRCEDFASKLKKIGCPNITPEKDLTVVDLFGKDSKYKMLEGSGLKLHPDMYNVEINIGKTPITDDTTVADVLIHWADKARIYSYVKVDGNGDPCLMVGRAFFSTKDKDSVMDLQETPKEILFDYHVAANNLTLMNTDKNFFAVEATSLEMKDGKQKFYHITIRKNPEYDPNKAGSKPYQILNETKLSKKAMKAGATVMSKSKDRIDLSTYTIVPYMSRKIDISHEDLQMEAIKYFEDYNMTGIEGTITVFGDLALKSTTRVKLVDNRHPAKNGYYLLGEVSTSFGVDGYRQTLKLPYCISREGNTKK